MKITIKSRQPVEKEIELTESDIDLVRSWAVEALLCHVKFHDYKSCYQGPVNSEHIDFCQRFGVDHEIDADRIEFFKAVINVSL
jgi:hypothetical protein